MEASSCPWAEAAPVRACACDGARQPTPTAGGSRHLALVPTRHHGMTCSVPTQTPHLLMYIVLCATTCWASSGARFGPPGPGHLPSADDGFSFIHSISRALPFSGEHEGEHEQSRGRRLGSHVHCLAAADMSRARHPEPGDVSSGLSTALAPSTAANGVQKACPTPRSRPEAGLTSHGPVPCMHAARQPSECSPARGPGRPGCHMHCALPARVVPNGRRLGTRADAALRLPAANPPFLACIEFSRHGSGLLPLGPGASVSL